MADTFAGVAFVLSVFAYIPFVLTILAKGNRQNPITWFGFFLINGVVLISGIADGKLNLPVLAYEIGIGAIVVLSIFIGRVTWALADKLVLSSVLVLLCAWPFTSGLSTVLLALFAVYVSTIPLWRTLVVNPKSQPALPWAIWAIGSLCQLIANGPIETWIPLRVLPTLGLLLQQLSILVLILPRRHT